MRLKRHSRKKMKTNEINSNTIAEGIDKSIFGIAFKSAIIGVLGAMIIIILFVSYNSYSNWKWEKEICGDGGCPMEHIQAIDPCMKASGTNTLVCEVHNINNESQWITQYGFCGYEEANAWFEQIKNNYGGKNAKIECSDL